ncbi:MAG: hypothetical protein DMF61_23895 [Blastocatellia bacterium AA13]|nr:MAG: hypothetical protein DMF61_23895 [Blastocatellia bacterium AA13]
MRLQNKVALQFLIFITVISAAPATAAAMDGGFNEIVHHIESYYHAKRTRIPFLGMANLFVKGARPGGVKEFKLAVFEDQDFGILPDNARFTSDIESSLGSEWHPLVQVYSHPQNELTRIYVKEDGTDVKLLLLTIEAREATVIQVKLDPELLVQWLNHPDKMGDISKGNRSVTID